MPSIRKANRMDCYALIPRLREADVQEIEALGFTPERGVLGSFDNSEHVFTIEHGGLPIAIFGGADDKCSDCTNDRGVPWLLASDGIRDHYVWFVRSSLEIVGMVQQHYGVLHNLVDVRNTLHIRWLKWCGFEMGDLFKIGNKGEEFQYFRRERNVRS